MPCLKAQPKWHTHTHTMDRPLFYVHCARLSYSIAAAWPDSETTKIKSQVAAATAAAAFSTITWACGVDPPSQSSTKERKQERERERLLTWALNNFLFKSRQQTAKAQRGQWEEKRRERPFEREREREKANWFGSLSNPISSLEPHFYFLVFSLVFSSISDY